MLLKKNLISQFQKLIYVLFILWVGVLAPLVYFDGFATNHRVQPYRFALFENYNRIYSPPSASMASRVVRQIQKRLIRKQDVISATRSVPGVAHSLQWSLGQLYVVAGITGLVLVLLGRLRLAQQLTLASVDVPPAKKPPRRA